MFTFLTTIKQKVDWTCT